MFTATQIPTVKYLAILYGTLCKFNALSTNLNSLSCTHAYAFSAAIANCIMNTNFSFYSHRLDNNFVINDNLLVGITNYMLKRSTATQVNELYVRTRNIQELSARQTISLEHINWCVLHIEIFAE